jgi:hypothetical protein
VPPRWRVTIEAAPPVGVDRRLNRASLPVLIQALRHHSAAGLIAGGSSCGAKLTVQAPDVEAALDAGLHAWRAAARDAGLIQWSLVRCEAVKDPRRTHKQSEALEVAGDGAVEAAAEGATESHRRKRLA